MPLQGQLCFIFIIAQWAKGEQGISYMRWMSGLIQIMFVTVSAAFWGSEGSLYICFLHFVNLSGSPKYSKEIPKLVCPLSILGLRMDEIIGINMRFILGMATFQKTEFRFSFASQTNGLGFPSFSLLCYVAVAINRRGGIGRRGGCILGFGGILQPKKRQMAATVPCHNPDEFRCNSCLLNHILQNG